VAHSLSAKKRIRQSAKRRGRNRWRKDQLKDTVKAFDQAVLDGKLDEAAAQLKVVYRRLDKVAAKGTIHKNAAARKKARLTRQLNKARKGTTTA
jgi:small subunit ribosomal protein S20